MQEDTKGLRQKKALPFWYLIVLSVLLLPYPFGILLYYLSFFCLTLLVSYCIVCPSSALPLWYLIVKKDR
jgi:membrane protein insertase Oxa1/YidC/SpoIIIJ